MKKKSIKFNAVLNVIKQVSSLIFPLITFPYASRVLGVENYGKINFTSSLVVYFSLLAALGVQTYAVREGARLRADKKKIGHFANQIFSINMITTIISYVLLFILCFSWGKLENYTFLIFVQSFVIICATVGCEWINIIFEDYTYITLRYLILQILSIICMFLFVKDANDYVIYAGVSTLAQVGAGLLNIFYIRKYVKIKLMFKNIDFKKHMKPLIILFAVTLSSYLYINSDITMLGVFRNDSEVGIYSTATKVYNMVKQLVCAIIVVIVPRVSALLGEKKYREYNELLGKIMEMTVLIILPMTIGLFMESRQVIMLLAGEEYLESYRVLRFLCLAIIPACLAYFYSTSILVPNRQESVFLKATVVSAIVNITLNLLFIPMWGGYGAAITTVISEIIVLSITLVAARKYHTKIKVGRAIIVGSIGGMLIAGICYCVNRFIVKELVNMVLAVGLSCIVYGMCLVIGKFDFFTQAVKRLNRK